MCCSSWWFTTPLWVWIGGDVPYRGYHQWCPHPTPTGGWYTSNLNDTLWKKTKETFVNSLIPIKKGSQLFVILWTLMSWCRCKLAGPRHFFGYHRRSHVSRQTCAGGFWFSFSFLSFTLIFYLKIVSSWCKCKLAGTRHFLGYHRRSHVSRQTCAGGFWSSFLFLSFTIMWGSNLASYIPYSGPLGISLPSFDIRGISPLHPSSKVKPRMGVKFPVRRDFTRNNEKKVKCRE